MKTFKPQKKTFPLVLYLLETSSNTTAAAKYDYARYDS